MRDKKYKFIYKTTNLINGKIYIGYHCTNNLNDGYIGCGCRSQAYAKSAIKYGLKSAFLSAVVKYGYENFKSEIIFKFDTIEECLNKEIEIVNNDWIKDSKNYNTRIGGVEPPINFKLTKIQEEELFLEFMNGVKKKDICLNYNISPSVIYRLTKNKDTSLRLPTKNTKKDFINNWILNESQKYIEDFKNWRLSKEDIRKLIPFDLYRNNFLKDIQRIKRFICITPNGEEYLFDTAKEISDILKIKIFNSGFLPVVKGKNKTYKNLKFKYNA